MRHYLLLLAIAITSITASAQKQNTTDTLCVTTTPQMHCEGCEKKIKSNLRFVKGLKKIETSVKEQKVTLIYDNRKTDYQTIAAAFKSIGYNIEKITSK